MEIFSYHKGLNKLVEIGNSGMFRPEMLESLGLPSNMRVYGWGLSLERPTMISTAAFPFLRLATANVIYYRV
jgi:phenylalanyl-tRNA synthetase alpha chain